MGTPLYSTDIIPLTSRPTLTVMDDGDYFVILDTSTGKISKILKTNIIIPALKISYDNTTSELTAETVQAALDELVVNLGSSDSAISALSGRLDTLEGTGEGSVKKAIDDAVSQLEEDITDHEERIAQNESDIGTLEGVVDTNRLYSDSQYLALKAKADSLQVKCNTLQAEVYTDAPILQYGATEIIGKGYEADDTPIDVSANVVDGKLSMEQKGLTITNAFTGKSITNTTLVDGIYTLDTGAYDHMSMIVSNGQIIPPSQVCYIEIEVLGGTYTETITFHVPNSIFSSGFSFRGIGKYSFIRTSRADYTGILYNIWLLASTIQAGTNLKIKINIVNLTALGLDHITDTDILADLLPYVDGTKNVPKLGLQILDADDAVTQTIFLPAIGNSLPNGVADSVKTVADGWEHSKRVSTPVSVASGVAVNTTNYPTAKDGGQWVNELTAGGTEIGVVGTDSTTGAGMLRFELATPIVTKYDLPHLTSGKTIHRFAGEEKIALYGTGLTFSENVLSVLSAIKFVAGVMTDITSLATITGDTVTFSGVNATDVVYVKVEHDVDRPLGVLEHTPAVSNTASRLASLEARVSALEA